MRPVRTPQACCAQIALMTSAKRVFTQPLAQFPNRHSQNRSRVRTSLATRTTVNWSPSLQWHNLNMVAEGVEEDAQLASGATPHQDTISAALPGEQMLDFLLDEPKPRCSRFTLANTPTIGQHDAARYVRSSAVVLKRFTRRLAGIEMTPPAPYRNCSFSVVLRNTTGKRFERSREFRTHLSFSQETLRRALVHGQ